jgi:hypothetical protein
MTISLEKSSFIDMMHDDVVMKWKKGAERYHYRLVHCMSSNSSVRLELNHTDSILSSISQMVNFD